MNPQKPNFRALLFAAIFALFPCAQTASAHGAPIPEHSAISAPPVAVAREFLNSLGPAEKSAAVLAVDHPARAQWSNLPARMVSRVGIRSGDLTDPQWELLFKFLSVALSPQGYGAVGEVVAAEAALARLEPEDPWSPDNYWLAFFGEPSENGKWGWHFGGHHLAVNMALEGNEIVAMSPTFIGAEPIDFVLKGERYQPLARMRQAGAAIYEALDENQRANAHLRSLLGIRQLETGAGEDGNIPPFKGSHVKEWSDAQRELLVKAVGEWVNLRPPPNADERMKELTAQLDDTYFAWRGPVDGSDNTYFRIQGPSVIIELLLRGATGAGNEGHYHAIYRNPNNEYGGQLK